MKNFELIGSGGFGKVWKCLSDGGSRSFAIKRVPMDFGTLEVDLLKALDHSNTISLVDYYYLDQYCYLTFPFMKDGDLSDIIHKFWTPEEGLGIYTLIYLFQLFKGLNYLSGLNPRCIIHRDIKPQNLLIDHDQALLKIADFGCAEFLNEEETEKFTTNIGTRWYTAPEMNIFCDKDRHYKTEIDVWSAGCIIYETITSFPLFPSNFDPDKETRITRQLEAILKVLTPPSGEDLNSLDPISDESKAIFQRYTKDQVVAANTSTENKLRDNLKKFSPTRMNYTEALDLLLKILKWDAGKRPRPIEIMIHSFFDNILIQRLVKYPNEDELKPIRPFNLFEFSQNELQLMPISPRNIKLFFLQIATYHHKTSKPD